jgi:hypothetical protein
MCAAGDASYSFGNDGGNQDKEKIEQWQAGQKYIRLHAARVAERMFCFTQTLRIESKMYGETIDKGAS